MREPFGQRRHRRNSFRGRLAILLAEPLEIPLEGPRVVEIVGKLLVAEIKFHLTQV